MEELVDGLKLVKDSGISWEQKHKLIRECRGAFSSVTSKRNYPDDLFLQ